MHFMLKENIEIQVASHHVLYQKSGIVGMCCIMRIRQDIPVRPGSLGEAGSHGGGGHLKGWGVTSVGCGSGVMVVNSSPVLELESCGVSAAVIYLLCDSVSLLCL